MAPILVLLPGLDGSGELFAPLRTALGTDIDCRVLVLPTDGAQDQQVLASRLLSLLPNEPFVLLAESFSVAIAVAIARLQPPALQQVILVAGFLESPRPLLLRLPLVLFRLGWRLRRTLSPLWWPFCAYRRDHPLRQAVLNVLDVLPFETVWARLQAIKQLRSGLSPLAVPVTVIHAADDRLVPKSVSANMNVLGTSITVEGPHFLLQSEPVVMADRLKTLLFSPTQPINHPV